MDEMDVLDEKRCHVRISNPSYERRTRLKSLKSCLTV
jgi:hypothetical protein